MIVDAGWWWIVRAGWKGTHFVEWNHGQVFVQCTMATTATSNGSTPSLWRVFMTANGPMSLTRRFESWEQTLQLSLAMGISKILSHAMGRRSCYPNVLDNKNKKLGDKNWSTSWRTAQTPNNDPDSSCMVFLPTFTYKITQVRKYTIVSG